MSKITLAIIIIAIIVVVLLAIYLILGGLGTNPTDNTSKTTQNTLSAGLKVQVIKEGSGVGAKTGDMVTVHYTGTLENGTKFDSSVDRNTPFAFILGGKVIKGWNEGVVGMKVGETRKLTIPPDLAYGANGVPPVIPPNSTLIFEIQMLKIN